MPEQKREAENAGSEYDSKIPMQDEIGSQRASMGSTQVGMAGRRGQSVAPLAGAHVGWWVGQSCCSCMFYPGFSPDKLAWAGIIPGSRPVAAPRQGSSLPLLWHASKGQQRSGGKLLIHPCSM